MRSRHDRTNSCLADIGARLELGIKNLVTPSLRSSEICFRTSSASNVGDEKDTLKRQRAAIDAFARSRGYRIVDEFCDAAVSGSDAIEDRPGFAALLDRNREQPVRFQANS